MNLARFDSELRSSLGDRDESFYSSADRFNAAMQASREYSKYRPVRRKFGTARMFASVAAGDVSAIVVGGPINAGDTLQIEPYNSSRESLVVQSVAKGADTPLQLATVSKVTFTAPFTQDHPLGTLITPSKPGLSVVGSQNYYEMPPDWIKPEQESFDIAIGAKARIKRGTSYYDAVYSLTNQMSGVGSGTRMLSGLSTGSWPFFGNPNNNPNGVPGGGIPGDVVYRFTNGEPPLLEISPPPIGTGLLSFDYWGSHSFDTIPVEDSNAVLAWAKLVCYRMRMGTLGGRMDFQDDDVNESPSGNVGALAKMVDSEMADFHRMIVDRPYIVSG